MMNHHHQSDENLSDSSRTPLISIGLAIFAVLMVPVFLYSVGPEGPIKVGDVVFSTDQHRVKFVDPTILAQQGYRDFCILESRVQLVVQKIDIPSTGSMVAEPVGVENIDMPYCPSRTPVILHVYQVTLKADLWGGLRDSLSHVVSGE